MNSFSPATDTAIAKKYASDSLEQKAHNKLALQKELGWAEEAKRPMICLPTGMSEKLGGNLLKEMLPGLLELPVEIVILGKGSASFGTYLTDIAKEHAHRMAIVANDEKHIRKMLAGADMALFLTDASAMPELIAALRYAAVPVAPTCKVLSTYDPNQESGNSFLYAKPTVWHCFAAVVRALETYRFPFDWKTIQRQCMERVEEK